MIDFYTLGTPLLFSNTFLHTSSNGSSYLTLIVASTIFSEGAVDFFLEMKSNIFDIIGLPAFGFSCDCGIGGSYLSSNPVASFKTNWLS
jgi:hypothetical protein